MLSITIVAAVVVKYLEVHTKLPKKPLQVLIYFGSNKGSINKIDRS